VRLCAPAALRPGPEFEAYDRLHPRSDRDPAAAARRVPAGGLRGAFWLNILLTLLGYLPGIVHAVWIIARR
jgi:hypothetical protein